jgi:hypothetical protein
VGSGVVQLFFLWSKSSSSRLLSDDLFKIAPGAILNGLFSRFLLTALLLAALLLTALLLATLLRDTLLLATLLRDTLLLATLLRDTLLLATPLLLAALLLATVLPSLPARAAAPAKALAPGIAAPVKARPLPAVIVPTISPPLPNEDLCLLDDVEAAERGAQSLRRNRSRLEAVGQHSARDKRDRCRQCQTNPTHRFLLEPKLEECWLR